MTLFYYTREENGYIDNPHVSIKIGAGCPAGCDCDFSYKKIKKEIVYDVKSIIKNIDFIDKNFSSSFEIFLVGLNILNYEYLFDILDYIHSRNRKFKIQIPHFVDEKDYLKLEELSKKYGKFDCSIPKTIDSYLDLTKLIKLITDFNKIYFSGKLYFDIFLDLEKYDKIINLIINNLSTTKSKNKYNCIIGSKFDIKFHDLSWEINKQKNEISGLKRRKCLMKNYFILQGERILLNDHIEILPSGDLTFHDNLCYLGHFSISNIEKNNSDIFLDFEKYKKYLGKISNGDLVKQCFKCLNNKYNFKKELEFYEY